MASESSPWFDRTPHPEYDHPSFMADSPFSYSLDEKHVALTPSSSVNFPVGEVRAFFFREDE